MRDFEITFESTYNELLEFIHKYEILDYKEPFTNNILSNLKSLIEELNTSQRAYANQQNRQYQHIKTKFETLTKDLEKSKRELDSKLKDDKINIYREFENKVNNLKIEIDEHKKQFDFNKHNKILDIEFYIIGSEQHIEMFENEYKDNTNRFGYQYSVAKDSYNDNVIHYNNLLENQLNKLQSNFSNIITEFDKETEGIINSYNQVIQENTILLEQKIAEFKEIMVQLKDKKRNHTIELNDKIRQLVDIKNGKINEIRATFSSSSNNSAIEKENKRQEYNLESQRISRDFVIKTNELDEAILEAKTTYNTTKDNKTEELQEILFDLNRQLENKIKKILKESNELSLKQRHEIKKLSRQFNTIQETQKIRTNYEIENLTLEHIIENEKNIYAKKLLDIDRTSSIKRLSEQETRDNKYYQEVNNQHELFMNYKIQLANSTFTSDANNVRLEGSLNELNIEKAMAELVANHEKEVEVITSSIKKAKLEIEVAIGINKLLHELEELKYQKKNNYLTVTNLLEIEKCKVLDTYNKSQYELNVLNYDYILDYSKKKIMIQNEKYEKLEKLKLNIDHEKLSSLILSSEFKVKEYGISEKYEYSMLDNKHKYAFDVLNLNLLAERFKCELKTIHFNMAMYTLLVRDLEAFAAKFIDYIFDSIIFRPEHLDIIRIFVDEFTNICFSYFTNISRNFKDIIYRRIQDRLQFEEQFKFSESYTILKEKYISDLSALNIEKTSVYSNIEDYNNRIEENRTKIFRLESSIAYNKNEGIINKVSINETKRMITDLYKEINIIKKELLISERNIAEIDKRLLDVEKQYVVAQNEIKQRQYNSALAYYELGNDISKKIEDLIILHANKIHNNPITEEEFDSFKDSIVAINSIFIEYNTYGIKELYKILNKFSNSCEESISLETKNIEIENSKNINTIKNRYNLLLSIEKMKYSKLNRKQQENLKKAEYEYNQTVNLFNKKEKINEITYQQNIKQVLIDKKNSTNQFYIELYAICDNAKDILDDYNSFINSSSSLFKFEKHKLIESSVNKRIEIDSNLTTYIKTRNDLINNLPKSIKFKVKNMNIEAKKKNKEVDDERILQKTQYNIKRKRIKKNMSVIESTFQANISKIDNDQKLAINKEKKHNSLNIKKHNSAYN